MLCGGKSERTPTTKSALSACSVFSATCGAADSVCISEPFISADTPRPDEASASLAEISQRQRHDSHQRNPNPCGPAIQLVEYLIEGFVQQEGVQQVLKIRFIGRQEMRALGLLPVRAQEFRGHRPLPEAGPRLQSRQILGTSRGVVNQGCVSGIAEGSQHSGNVLQRALF